MKIHRLFVVGLLVLVACSFGASAGDPERGRQIYDGTLELNGGRTPACIMCHPVQPGQVAQVMGQNLSDIGLRAATAVEGQTAEEYLRTAIVDPDAYLAGGFQEGIMYRNYGRDLTPQQINDLIAYLQTLQTP